MTEETQASQAQDQNISNKELNFRNLEAKYQKELAQERAARLEAERARQEIERAAQEALARKQQDDDEDDDGVPYVDKKKLKKEQDRFGQQIKKETQSEIQRAVQVALEEERKNAWLEQNPDFYDVLNHAEKLPQISPELAKTILKMPDGFERQKLVYANIKALGLNKPQEKAPSIQEKIDANRRSPYYQPTGIGTAPYSQVGDFSATGQKQAFEKMKELQAKMRL